MKRFLLLFTCLSLFIGIKTANALDSFCWDPNTGELNSQLKTNEYGCGPDTCLDDDGITPYCVQTPIGGTINWSTGTSSGSYPMGSLQNVNAGGVATGDYINFVFNFNVPMWKSPLLKSISITSKTNDGTTQFYDGYLPISYDYCSTGDTIQNSGNFSNMFFDGYSKLPVEQSPYPYTYSCYRVYARMKVKLMYFLPNQVQAVPVEYSSYYYVKSDNVLTQFYNKYNYNNIFSVNNLQYYTFNDYMSILDDIEYRNYLYDTGDIEKDYYESQKAFIDTMLNSSPPNTDGLNGSVGWLPAGPVDSLLNLPLSMLTNLSDSLGGTCQSVNLTLPFVDKDLPLPCLYSIYNQIDGLSLFLNTTGIIAAAFILYKYLLNLYKWVDDTLTFRENNMIDNWGGF